jgi:hypothetical protein
MRAGAQRALARALFPTSCSSTGRTMRSPAGSAIASSAAGILHAQPMCIALAAAPLGGSSTLGGSSRFFSAASSSTVDVSAGGVASAVSDGGSDDADGRASAPAAPAVGETQAEKDLREGRVPHDPILDIDPYPPERVRFTDRQFWNVVCATIADCNNPSLLSFLNVYGM